MRRWPAPTVVIGLVGLGFASVAIAVDLRVYYPLAFGTTRIYQIERHSMTDVGNERSEALGEGRLHEEVVGLSKLSNARRSVYKVRERIEFRGGGPFTLIDADIVYHVSVRENLVLLHAVNEDVYASPSVVLSDPAILFSEVPSFLIEGEDPLRASVGIISQTIESVTVPAGKFRKAIKQVFEGSLDGELDGQTLRDGAIREITWYAKRVGAVQRVKHRYFRLLSPEGIETVHSDTTILKLTSFSTP